MSLKDQRGQQKNTTTKYTAKEHESSSSLQEIQKFQERLALGRQKGEKKVRHPISKEKAGKPTEWGR